MEENTVPAKTEDNERSEVPGKLKSPGEIRKETAENRLQAYRQWIRGKMRRYGVYGRGKAPKGKSTLEGRKLAAQMGKIADQKKEIEG